jgi:hypothetical protein
MDRLSADGARFYSEHEFADIAGTDPNRFQVSLFDPGDELLHPLPAAWLHAAGSNARYRVKPSARGLLILIGAVPRPNSNSLAWIRNVEIVGESQFVDSPRVSSCWNS